MDFALAKLALDLLAVVYLLRRKDKKPSEVRGPQHLMAIWCHRPVTAELSKSERLLLGKIGRLYHLPPMVSRLELVNYAGSAGFSEVTSADWSRAVAPFWIAVIKTALRWESIGGLLRAGWPTIKGAWAMRYMQQGFRQGLIEFAVLQGRKER